MAWERFYKDKEIVSMGKGGSIFFTVGLMRWCQGGDGAEWWIDREKQEAGIKCVEYKRGLTKIQKEPSRFVLCMPVAVREELKRPKEAMKLEARIEGDMLVVRKLEKERDA